MIFVLTITNNVNDRVRTKIIGHYCLLITRNTSTLSAVSVQYISNFSDVGLD